MHRGTFTDYMIRKFFRDNLISQDVEIIFDECLTSEICLNHLYFKEIK